MLGKQKVRTDNMATKAEKSERRWVVIQGMLIGLGLYTLALVGMYVGGGVEVNELNHLTTMVFSLVGGLGVSNWMSAPTEDD